MPGGWVTQARDPKGSTTGGRWTDDAMAVWARGLSDEQQKALITYGTTGYRDINGSLRDGVEDELDVRVKDELEAIDDAFSSAPPLVQEATVYRGMVIVDFEPEVGATFVDHGFVSTTMKPEIAGVFRQYKVEQDIDLGESAIAMITVPPGTRGIAMTRVWEAQYGDEGGLARREREVLLNRGSRFRVTKVGRDRKGRRRLALELLPPLKKAA